MYCDCVYSYDDVIAEDATSHDSDGDDDDDDESFVPNVEPMDYPFHADTPEKRPPDVSPPRPLPKKPRVPPAVLVDKPIPDAGTNPSLNDEEFVDVEDQTNADFNKWQEDQKKKPPARKKKPSYKPPKKEKKPSLPNDGDLAIRYFNHGVPYPYLTSPSINYVVDNLKVPIYTGPQVPDSFEWNDFLEDELRPWYEKLPLKDKRTYMDACFTADPKDGQGNGSNSYYKVSMIENHGATSGDKAGSYPFTYIITPLEGGDPKVVSSDIRLPPRAFNDQESFDKYFKPANPGIDDGEYICAYKVPYSRADKIDNKTGEGAYRFYQSSSTATDPHPVFPIIDPTIPDPTPLDTSFNKPHPKTLDARFFSNSPDNTDVLNGYGYKEVETPSGKFEPFFNLGYVNMSIWKTTTDKGTPLGYPIGNVPNLTGMSGLIAPLTVRGVSNAAGVVAKGIASNSPVHVYGYQVPMTAASTGGFRFPCEMVSRYASGQRMYACVWVKSKVIDWVPNNNLHYNMRVDKNTIPASYYYPAVYKMPIIITDNGRKRIDIDNMQKLKDEDDISDVRLQNLTLNQDVWFCALVSIADGSPILDISRGGLPFIEVKIGGKATTDAPTVSGSDFKFEITEISSLWKDNSTWGEFDFAPSFDGTGGKQAKFPNDFTGDTSTPAYYNRMLTYHTWFETTPQLRTLCGVFKNYNLSTRVLCGDNRISNDSTNHWKGRKIFWPMLYTNSSNLDYWITGCSLDGTDNANVGAGYIQGKVGFFKCPTNWMPMIPGITVPPYP